MKFVMLLLMFTALNHVPAALRGWAPNILTPPPPDIYFLNTYRPGNHVTALNAYEIVDGETGLFVAGHARPFPTADDMVQRDRSQALSLLNDNTVLVGYRSDNTPFYYGLQTYNADGTLRANLNDTGRGSWLAAVTTDGTHFYASTWENRFGLPADRIILRKYDGDLNVIDEGVFADANTNDAMTIVGDTIVWSRASSFGGPTLIYKTPISDLTQRTQFAAHGSSELTLAPLPDLGGIVAVDPFVGAEATLLDGTVLWTQSGGVFSDNGTDYFPNHPVLGSDGWLYVGQGWDYYNGADHHIFRLDPTDGTIDHTFFVGDGYGYMSLAAVRGCKIYGTYWDGSNPWDTMFRYDIATDTFDWTYNSLYANYTMNGVITGNQGKQSLTAVTTAASGCATP